MKFSNKALQYYQYRPPMPLENVSNNYFYCMPGGLPPLPPPRNQCSSSSSDNNNNKKNNNKNNSSCSAQVQRRVHWPENLDQHKQVVEFDKQDAILECHLGSPFDGDWFYDAQEDIFYDALECEPRVPSWWEWDASLQYRFMETFPRVFYFCGLVYLFFVDILAGDCEDMDWEDEDDEEIDEDEWGVAWNDDDDEIDDEDDIECEDSGQELAVDEVSPPEVQSEDTIEIVSEYDDLSMEVTSFLNEEGIDVIDIHSGSADDDKEEDEGSDYYFSLPCAIEYLVAEDEDDLTYSDDEVSVASTDVVFMDTVVLSVHEGDNDQATVASFENMASEGDFMVEDVCLKEVSIPESDHVISIAASALGSIWVQDPNHGLVRRSARLRARG